MGMFKEMNVHMPQSVQTMCELMDFASVPYHIITPKDGEPIMEIIQDTMTGAFRLTKDYVRIGDKVFANLQMVNSYFDGHLPVPIDDKKHQYNGFQAFSLIMPPSFYLETKNGQEVKVKDIDETGKEIVRNDKEKVIIKNSTLVSGTLDKTTFNSMSRGIIPVIFHDYGPFELQRFLDNTQRLICRWLVTSGFSVGISDLVTDDHTEKAMKDAVAAMKDKAYKIIDDARRGKLENKTIFANADNFERMLINILNEASSETGSIGLKEINDKTNRMINMIKSGAKGKKSNVAQMIALVGQQNIEGKRVGYGFTDRTLPHFTKYDDGPEARGFVENSFISGLTPQEVFFHAMSGREGLIDTAVKTSETGYIQRRLVKAMEDCKIYYDQTVRNAGGSIVQFIYGEDGMEGTKVEKQFIPTIDMDLIELDAKYHLRPEDALQIHMHPEAFKRMKDDHTWVKRCDDHFQKMVDDREYLIKDIFAGEKQNMIIYPIPFDRILKNARARITDAGLDGVPSDLTPAEILDEIDRLSNKLYVNVPKQGTRFLEILLRVHLSPKPMIMRYHMTKETFKWIIEEIERRYYEAIAPAGEMVGIIAAQSLGEPATQLSTSSDTKIRIMSGEDLIMRSYNGEIGPFIDKLMKKYKKDVLDLGNNSTALYLKDDYYIIGVSNDEKTSWKRILEVSRHPANGGMVTVKTRSGRKTTATLSHSFLKRTENGIEPIEGSKLKIGDRIPVAYNIPTVENPLTEIEMNEKYFKLDRDFGWIIGAYLADGNATSNITISKIDPIFEEKIRKFSITYGYTVNIRITQGTIDMDPRYADRVYTSKQITIGGNGSYKLTQWFINNFGTGSYNKTIPAWVFASNQEFIAGIISGYFDGDGNVNADKQMIRCHSVCENLIDNIALLLAYCGIFATKHRETRKREKANLFHILQVSRKYADKFKKVIGFETAYKAHDLNKIIEYNERDNKHSDQEMIDKIPECGNNIAYIGKRLKLPGQSRLYRRWLNKDAIGRRTLEKYVTLFKAANDIEGNLPDVKEHIDKLEMALKGDVVWDEIIELEYLPDPESYVYDFTVPGNDSFMVDTGVLVHNTLDSFHSSGTAAAVKATSGVPRLKELLSVTKNIKTPALRIHFKSDIGTVINPPEAKDKKTANNDTDPVAAAKGRVLTLMHKFEMTRMYDILEMSEIFWDPPGDTGLYTGIEDDKGLLELYRIFQRVQDCNSKSPWVLRMRLNKEKMHAQGLTMLDVYTNIEKTHGDAIECIFSDDNADDLIFRIRIMDVKAKEIDVEDTVAALKAVEYNIVNNVILKGVDGIRKGSMRLMENRRYNPETMSFDSIAEWIMDTDGTNLEAFLSNPNIDKTRTISNDVCEIYRVLGIEAARNALYNEIMEVIRESSINYRHMSLLMDTITYKGALMSVDRHGLTKTDTGPLAKSSFEETTNMLIDASVFSEYDRINGISANIMLGQLPPCGTGDSEILLDEDRFAELIKDLPQKPMAIEDEAEEAEMEIMEPCRPQDIAFNFEMPTTSRVVAKLPEPKITFT